MSDDYDLATKRLIPHGGRVALCHDWMTTLGGADQVAARIARTLSIESIYAYAVWPNTAETLLPGIDVEETGPKSSWTRRHWPWFLPHMPLAWRSLDLAAYDLVMTSAHSCVNAIKPRSDALLVSYCHTPMRYAWEWRAELARVPLMVRPLWRGIAAAYRKMDRRWAQRVDLFLANSRFVASRIRNYYGRGSFILHPPIDTSFWTDDGRERSDFFLVSGRLVAYKRPDLAVEAARRAGVPVVVAGDGPMLPRLRKMSGDVRFVRQPTREQLRDLYRRARAYLFAGVEDFGMSIVEAQACGAPVIATRDGGACETIQHGVTGILVPEGVERLSGAIRRFDDRAFEPKRIRSNAQRFDAARFDETLKWVVGRATEGDWQAILRSEGWTDAGRRT